MCKEKNIFLNNHVKKTKANQLNSSKLHFNRRRAKILNTGFLQHISKVFKWQLADNSSASNFPKFDFEKYGSGQAEVDYQNVLKWLCKDNWRKLSFAQLNINSIRNKFDCLSQQLKVNIDILLFSETKIDDSFPISQFIITGFSPLYKLDRSCHGVGLILLVRKDIPSNLLAMDEEPIESFYIELNLRNSKGLIIWS